MKTARLLALLGLLLTLGPAALFALGLLAEGPMKLALLGGTILWFAAAPRWLGDTGD